MKRFSRIAFSLLLIILVQACARPFNPDIERGSTYKFKDGFPEVRLSAIGFLDEGDEPLINIAADIVYGSLIYKEKDGIYTAKIAVEIRILDQENPENMIKANQFSFTIEEKNKTIVNNQDVFTFERRIKANPGEYQINLTVVDQNSGKRTTRVSNTFIPDPQNEISSLTNIRMLGKDSGEHDARWMPITTYDVAGKIDSLKFIFQVTNNKSEQPLTIDTKLIKYDSDTSVARPMHYNNYSPSSITYRGIDYDETEIIQSNRRVLTQTGSVLIEYTFPNQERGNYRFEVNTNENKGTSLFKARDFGIKSTHYPSLKTPEELARPLIYLMSEKDHEKLMAIKDSDSLKQAIDRFWLRNTGDKSKARSVIELYYERVEEANKQFSSFKEGWKTDPGMVYILFGPPWYVEQHLDVMRWSYAYNRADPEYNYMFEKSKLKSEFYPFDNYLLQRRQMYFNIQYQQIQLWLSGNILTRSI